MIGDVILFHLAAEEFNLVGRAPVLNWVTYHAQTGGYDVRVTLDQRSALRTDGRRKHYRFQVQGPHAMDVIARAMETHPPARPPELKFFNLTTTRIGNVSVRALRHGMAGQPGWELFGPWDDYDAVHSAIVDAGEEFGLRLVGGRAYSSNALESGWIPSPLPAVYTGDELRAYREWLPANGYEGSASIGGSFVSSNVEDYYFTPWDLGYGHLVKFDHDFIGREALERMADGEHRHKVTLALDDEDVADTIATMFGKTDRAKFIDWPSAVYAMHPFDRVTANGDTVGVSTWIGYSFNEGKMLTLAVHRLALRRARHRGHVRVGRGERRHFQADRRAPRSARAPGGGQPGPVRRGGAKRLRARQLALGAPLSAPHNRTPTNTTAPSGTNTAPAVSLASHVRSAASQCAG